MDNAYHIEQFHTPKRSTVAFCDFLESSGAISGTQSILDVGAGMGGVIHYMSQKWNGIRFVGMEKKAPLVEAGNRILKGFNDSAELIHDDIYRLGKRHGGCFDGIISVQTLSWLPKCEEAIEKMVELDPKWIAITSLFYDGPVSCDIHVKEYHGENNVEEPHLYRIYSLDRIKDLLTSRGFNDIDHVPFEIGIDIPRPGERLMQTYTEKLADGRRLQISGPLLMPWFFIISKRSDFMTSDKQSPT